MSSSGIIEGGSHISSTWMSGLGTLFNNFATAVKQSTGNY
jgi:hypothetical protein